MIIGITGKSGSGKSYLSELLATELNAKHIKIDEVSHYVLTLEKTLSLIRKEFGDEVFDANKLNRKKLGEIVFNDKEKLAKLNQFCQSEMEIILNKILNNTKETIILDYALLPWMSQFALCDVKILIDENFEERFKRIHLRDNISIDYFTIRDNSIKNYNKDDFNIVLQTTNNISISELAKQIQYIGGNHA